MLKLNGTDVGRLTDACRSLAKRWRAMREERDEWQRNACTVLSTAKDLGKRVSELEAAINGFANRAGMFKRKTLPGAMWMSAAAAAFLDLLDSNPDAENYLDARFDAADGRAVVVNVRRFEGKTPGALVEEARTELAARTAERDALAGELEQAAALLEQAAAEKADSARAVALARLELVDKLRTARQSAPSVTCQRSGLQNCHFCDSIDCGDNTSPAAERVRGLVARLDTIQAQAAAAERESVCTSEAGEVVVAELEQVTTQRDTALSSLAASQRQLTTLAGLLAETEERRAEAAARAASGSPETHAQIAALTALVATPNAVSLAAFVAAFDRWSQSSELCGGPLYDAMLAAREEVAP